MEVCVRLLNGHLERDAIVALQTVNYGAVPQQDYLPQLFLNLTFTPNEIEFCYNITVMDDTVYENQETLSLTLTTLDAGIIVNPDVFNITILDDDGTLTTVS